MRIWYAFVLFYSVKLVNGVQTPFDSLLNSYFVPPKQSETAFWTEIVRLVRTQKLVTTTTVNALGDKAIYFNIREGF